MSQLIAAFALVAMLVSASAGAVTHTAAFFRCSNCTGCIIPTQQFDQTAPFHPSFVISSTRTNRSTFVFANTDIFGNSHHTIVFEREVPIQIHIDTNDCNGLAIVSLFSHERSKGKPFLVQADCALATFDFKVSRIELSMFGRARIELS